MSSQIYDILGIDLELLMVQKKTPKKALRWQYLYSIYGLDRILLASKWLQQKDTSKIIAGIC